MPSEPDTPTTPPDDIEPEDDRPSNDDCPRCGRSPAGHWWPHGVNPETHQRTGRRWECEEIWAIERSCGVALSLPGRRAGGSRA